MIQNNLDNDVAEDPDNLIVYGGKGKAARWKSYNAIISSLKRMNSDDTLLVQSGNLWEFSKHTNILPEF